MTESHDPMPSACEAELADILEMTSRRLAAGEEVKLSSLCRDHPEYAVELTKLLPTIEQMARLAGDSQGLDLNPELAGDPTPSGQSTQRQLGDFHIIRELGRGGMGTVYEAQQLSMDRRVALKVLPFAALLGDRQLQRFKNEARTAGTLHHPHIVPVYSVGVERGVHYYAMQYIEGPSLAEVLADLLAEEVGGARDVRSEPPDLPPLADLKKNAAAAAVVEKPQPSSTPIGDTRRELQALLSTARSSSQREYFEMITKWGIQASEALAHAHECGVLHRDIKPGNLLVDERGELWITDFGLARLEKDASMTASGDIVGTLRYMAPEQALAKRSLIDHRADIYSLGVTMYELLTLTPAFSGEDREAVLRSVAFDEPVPLRKHNAKIPTDLETIILKAIEKRLEDRYPTAEELADDLQRFLGQRPILAKRASLPQRVAKWSRRHVAVVWSLVFACLAVSVVMAVAITAVVNERSKVLQEQVKTKAALKRAEASALLAKEAVDEMYVNFAKEWIGSQLGLSDTERSFLEKAAAFYAQMPIDLESSAAAQVSAAKTLHRLSHVREKLGQPDKAKDAHQQAIAILEALHAKNSTSQTFDSRFELAKCYFCRSKGHWRQPGPVNDLDKAVQQFEQLYAEHPDDDKVGSRLACAKVAQAEHHHYLRDYDKADQLFAEAQAQLEQIVESAPDNLSFLDLLCTAVSMRAGSNLHSGPSAGARGGLREGRSDEARELFLHSVELARRLSQAAPGNIRYRYCAAGSLANAIFFVEPEQAVKLLREAEEQLKALYQQDPMRSDFREKLRAVNFQLLSTLTALSRHDEAVEVAKTNIALRADSEPRSQLKTAPQMARHLKDYRNLARPLEKLERWQEARQAIEESIILGRMAFQAAGERNSLHEDMQKLANICRQLGDEEAAKAAELERQQWIEGTIAELTQIIDDQPSGKVHFERAELYMKLEREDEALADYAKCTEYDPNKYLAYENRALIFQRRGQNDLALSEVTRAIDTITDAATDEIARAYEHRAQILGAMHRYEEALEDVQRALDVGHGHVSMYGKRGRLLYRLGRDQEALREFNTVLQRGGASPGQDAIVRLNLARLLTAGSAEVRDPERALELAEQLFVEDQERSALMIMGSAYYRLGRYEEAHDKLQEAMNTEAPDGKADDWLGWTEIMLAMTKGQLGDEQEARDWFWKAVTRFTDNASSTGNRGWPDVRRIIQEAASLLDIDLSGTMWTAAPQTKEEAAQ